MTAPLLTVLLPAYNAEKYIEETLNSILNQTFKDFELIVIDDCSTDNTNKLISKFSDERIRLIRNEENLKLIKTLNKGIKLANGKYLARIDADDICLLERFEKQIEYLETHPDTAVLGTDIEFIDEKSKSIGRGIKHPTMHAEILWGFYRRASIYHPTVMVNLELLKDDFYYDENYPHAEDYELWMRLGDKFQLANLDEILVRYRVHGESVTQSFNEISVQSTLRAIRAHSEINKDYEFALEYFKYPNRLRTDNYLEDIILIWQNHFREFVRRNNLSADERKKIEKNAMSFVIILSVVSFFKFLYIPSDLLKKSWRMFDFSFFKLLKLLKEYIQNIYFRVIVRVVKKALP